MQAYVESGTISNTIGNNKLTLHFGQSNSTVDLRRVASRRVAPPYN